MKTTQITGTLPSEDKKKPGIFPITLTVGLYTDDSATISRAEGKYHYKHLLAVDSARSLAGALVPTAIIRDAQAAAVSSAIIAASGGAAGVAQQERTHKALTALLAALDAEVTR